MKNWKTIKDLLGATLWGVCVLVHLSWHGRETTTEEFSGPFLTALGVSTHKLNTCPGIYLEHSQ